MTPGSVTAATQVRRLYAKVSYFNCLKGFCAAINTVHLGLPDSTYRLPSQNLDPIIRVAIE